MVTKLKRKPKEIQLSSPVQKSKKIFIGFLYLEDLSIASISFPGHLGLILVNDHITHYFYLPPIKITVKEDICTNDISMSILTYVIYIKT